MKSTPKQIASLMSLVDKKPPPLVTDERRKNDDNCDDDYDYDVPENNRPIKEDDTTMTSNNNKSKTIVESSATNVELLRPLSEQPSAQGDDLSIRKSLGSTMGSGSEKKTFPKTLKRYKNVKLFIFSNSRCEYIFIDVS